ncbi:hypothetical protein [uncultured Jatrophihabitans sp.]|uniref:hypothetical protein n=1 Tax=uncultured Jatrophihabitans sp. TaxID=1610747 RepID=UPI0035C9F0E8
MAPHDDRDDASSGDLASIWGAVETVTPPPPPPPDPSTRIDGPAPAAATFSQTPDEVAPADPYDNTDSDTLLPHVPWRGAVAEPHPFDTDEHRLDPADRSAIVEGGRPYPIPPAGAPDDRPPKMEVSTGTVPTWAFRAATQTPSGPFSYGDLALDPQSLRNKVTLRAGTASLSVDDSGLLVRMRMRRTSIPWHDVMGFEPRFDDDGGGRLAVLTQSGPVELAATRRPAGEVRYIHALLEAYRQRAALSGRS